MKYIFTLGFISIFLFMGSAQTLEDDIKIVFFKANVLYESGRYDESIRMYNQVLNEDPTYASAYHMRGKAKYALGAYLGTKKDIMKYIELNGITKDVIKIMAKTEYELENYEAANNYVTVALELDPYDSENYLTAANNQEALGDKSKACELWSSAAQLGSSKARKKLDDKCDVLVAIQKQNKRAKKNAKDQENVDPPKKKTTKNDEDEDDTTSNVIIEKADEDALHEIEFDDQLSVVVGNGLGGRKVENHPNIYLLSSNSGMVVIDICVDEKGKVIESTLNRDKTTLLKQSLTTLALRKSKEFEFFPSFRDEQCGTLTYVLK